MFLAGFPVFAFFKDELEARKSRKAFFYSQNYLRIIPRARMGSESIANEAEGRMGYWRRGYEGERNDCFSKIQLVSQKYRK